MTSISLPKIPITDLLNSTELNLYKKDFCSLLLLFFYYWREASRCKEGLATNTDSLKNEKFKVTFLCVKGQVNLWRFPRTEVNRMPINLFPVTEVISSTFT